MYFIGGRALFLKLTNRPCQHSVLSGGRVPHSVCGFRPVTVSRIRCLISVLGECRPSWSDFSPFAGPVFCASRAFGDRVQHSVRISFAGVCPHASRLDFTRGVISGLMIAYLRTAVSQHFVRISDRGLVSSTSCADFHPGGVSWPFVGGFRPLTLCLTPRVWISRLIGGRTPAWTGWVSVRLPLARGIVWGVCSAREGWDISGPVS